MASKKVQLPPAQLSAFPPPRTSSAVVRQLVGEGSWAMLAAALEHGADPNVVHNVSYLHCVSYRINTIITSTCLFFYFDLVCRMVIQHWRWRLLPERRR